MPEAKFFETEFLFGGTVHHLYILAYDMVQVRDVIKYLYQILAYGETINEIQRFEIPYGASIINAIS